ncbi:MAG: cupin domain-containing protein [Gemmatimonadota bacterium]
MSRPVRRGEGFRWEDVSLEPYKEEGSAFRDVSRQLLFGHGEGLVSDLRYFEVGPGGHTTLERHEHAHAVVVLRGGGRVLVDPEIREVRPFDLVHVPSLTWHQFQAADDEPLGFLCVADGGRDRPRRPTGIELEELRRRPEVAAFVRV